jgi:hypothetical protein
MGQLFLVSIALVVGPPGKANESTQKETVYNSFSHLVWDSFLVPRNSKKKDPLYVAVATAL